MLNVTNNPDLVLEPKVNIITYLKGVFKIGIVLSNLLTCLTGFTIGLMSNGGKLEFNLYLISALCLGLIFIIAGSCAWNTILENDIDGVMKRTRHRPTVTMPQHNKNIRIIANLLIIFGLSVLSLINFYVVLLGIVGIFIYIYLYTILLKRTSHYHTVVGSLSGIIPLLMGYTTVSQIFSSQIVLFSAFLFIWQIPHFYALAIYRRNDYANAGIPTVVSKYGVMKTLITCRRLILLLILIAIKMYFVSYTFSILTSLAGVYWLYTISQIVEIKNISKLARKSFGISIIVLMVACLTIFTEVIF
ncbi:MAG: protoheme farnesyltransferase [Bacillales bacterium]|nr:protoheme farnesyltransferase [Bacillales bacterium]